MVAQLEAPTAVDPRHDLIEYGLGASFVAPSWYLSKFADTVFGANPFDMVTEMFTGDWAAVDKASGAVAALARFGAESATAIRDSLPMLDSWSGDAALGAGTYFMGLATALNEQAGVLAAVADTIDQFATSVYEQGKAAGSLLETIFDHLATALILKAAADAAVASGNVPLMVQMNALAVVKIDEAIDKYNLLMSVMGITWAGVQHFEGVVRSQLASGDLHTLPSLPQVAYDNAEV